MASKKKRELELAIEKIAKQPARESGEPVGEKIAMARVVQTSSAPHKYITKEDLEKAGLKPHRRVDDWFPN